MPLFQLLDPAMQAPLSDANETVSRTDLTARAHAIAERLEAEGLAGARLCLALDASLGALATLVAVFEAGGRAALMARAPAGTDQQWPDFCDAGILPPAPGAPQDAITVVRLQPAAPAAPDTVVRDGGRILLHSSGTTGTPKWIAFDTGTLIDNAQATIRRMDLSAEDRVLIPVPIHHSYGVSTALIPSLLAGAAIRLVARGNPLTIFQAKRAFAPTVMFLVPSQIRSILTLGRKATRARLVVVAGDRLQPEEAAAFDRDHGTLVCLYGSTEMCAMTSGLPGDPAALRHLTAGVPMDGVELALAPVTDPDPADEGAVPMRIRAANGFMGYADPGTGAVTAPVPELWSTGDLVRLHDGPDGAPRIEVVGRVDHAVNRDGLLVHLGQVEGCIVHAEGVELTAVVPAGQSRRGTGLFAFCKLTRPGSTTPDAILAHCRASLPARAVPDRLELLDDMPMLLSGKVDRQALGALARQMADTAPA